MSKVEVFIFDVDHGLCASAQDSQGNLLIIDCGRKSLFSPIKYLALLNRVRTADLKVGLFILSHSHGDHIQDVTNLINADVRNRLWKSLDNFTSEELTDGNSIEGIANLEQFDHTFSHFTRAGYNPPLWDFNLNTTHSLSPNVARTTNKSAVLNNTSFIVILSFGDTKILFPGDIQSEGMKKLLEDESFVDDAKNSTIIVAPHHGHKSSYCAELYDLIGRPYIHICSLASNDPHIATQYSSERASIGAELWGTNRYMLSTRSDGTINITITEDSCTINCYDLDNND